MTFTVRPAGEEAAAAQQYAAVVVAVSRGTIVQRAATLVYLDPDAEDRPVVPIAAAAVAAALAAAVAVAVAMTARRRPTASPTGRG
jgi:mRNA-degrading endonuclease toxin of MazEF toxin-antitoxin module